MSVQEKLTHVFGLYEEKKFAESIKLYVELLEKDLSVDDEIQVRYGYGYPLIALGLVDEAIDNYTRLENLGKNMNDFEVISQAIHQQGMVYRQAGQYDKALDLFLREREFIFIHFKENKLFKSANNYELGYTHLLMGNHHESITYLDKSLIQAEESEDIIMIACVYRGIGEYHVELQNIEKAISYFEKSILYFEKAMDEIGIVEVKELMKAIT